MSNFHSPAKRSRGRTKNKSNIILTLDLSKIDNDFKHYYKDKDEAIADISFISKVRLFFTFA